MSSDATTTPALVTRDLVRAQVEARLAKRLNDAQLAGWAFDRFYRIEVGEQRYEPGSEELLADTLDELMFSDEPGFALDEEGLRMLVARLQTV
jgi:hypothetical protein